MVQIYYQTKNIQTCFREPNIRKIILFKNLLLQRKEKTTKNIFLANAINYQLRFHYYCFLIKILRIYFLIVHYDRKTRKMNI